MKREKKPNRLVALVRVKFIIAFFLSFFTPAKCVWLNFRTNRCPRLARLKRDLISSFSLFLEIDSGIVLEIGSARPN